MFTLFHQPYPITEKTTGQIVLTGFFVGLFVALFLIIFQPHGTNTVDFPGKTTFLTGYGVIAALGIMLVGFIPATFFSADSWTVGKQLLMITVSVLLILTVSYFYLFQLGGSPSWQSYGIFLRNAVPIAVFPVVGMTLGDYYLKFRHYSQGAEAYREKLPGRAIPEATVTAPELVVKDEQDRPIISLPTDRIWCLRSDRNYVDIFHLNTEGQVRKMTLRNTLTKIKEDLPANFLRCHRSYLVNADGVTDVSGNAQGYRLHNPDFPDAPVPVSRNKSAEILGFIRK